MEPTNGRKKIPAEAVDLYTQFIHGDISRRDFLDGVKRFAVGGLTATAIVEALMPNYALGQQVRKDDERIKASYETVPSPDGNGYIRGYLVRPFSADSRSATPAKLPGVLVIHENRGLNPHTEDVSRRFALENFMAFAPDALSSVGGYPGDDYRGGELFTKLDGAKRTQDFVAAAKWLKARPDTNGKLGAVGFCFGGGVVNTLAVEMGSDLNAAVPFYGTQPKAEDVAKIKAPVLAQYGELDTRITSGWDAYNQALTANHVAHEGYVYPKANHGFHNDTTPRYDEAAAKQAWERTVAWFNKYLRAAA
jgi:carboxymethylenebutenolidase